jgi:hypothetical protein
VSVHHGLSNDDVESKGKEHKAREGGGLLQQARQQQQPHVSTEHATRDTDTQESMQSLVSLIACTESMQ